MNPVLIIVITISFMGNLLVTADEEKSEFIPDANAQAVEEPKINAKPPPVLTPEKTLQLFLLLPEKVLPLSKASRKLAIENDEIASVTKDKLTTIRWKSLPFAEDGTEMTCIGYTTKKEPMFNVTYRWSNPGLISKSHSYTYLLTRKTNGWLMKRVK